MKRVFLILVFLVFAPLTLAVSLFCLNNISEKKRLQTLIISQGGVVLGAKNPLELYSALPPVVSAVGQEITTDDARPVIIKNYLEGYNSPMTPYDGLGQLIVEVSDKYGFDFRLLVAIAQQESNLGKKSPPSSYNAWGWGVHSQGTLKFSSWEEGIETVALGIKESYIDKGYDTPEKIMAKYTPASSGSWAFGVNQFLEEME